jgi:hypothetical protein
LLIQGRLLVLLLLLLLLSLSLSLSLLCLRLLVHHCLKIIVLLCLQRIHRAHIPGGVSIFECLPQILDFTPTVEHVREATYGHDVAPVEVRTI